MIGKRFHVLHVDFNDYPVTAVLGWYEKCPEIGERVLLVDGDFDAVKGTVRKIVKRPVASADYTQRSHGIVEVTYDIATWMDGEEVLTLALDRMEQTTTGTILLRALLSPSAASSEATP